MSPNTPPTNDISPTPTPSISDLTTDYARLAATDQSAEISVSAREARTHQSEEDFRREKEGYVARVDDGEVSVFFFWGWRMVLLAGGEGLGEDRWGGWGGGGGGEEEGGRKGGSAIRWIRMVGYRLNTDGWIWVGFEIWGCKRWFANGVAQQIWKQLTTLDPPFTPRPSHPTNTSDKSTGGEVSADSREGESVTEDQTSTPKPLGRKIFLLVSAAVGELYWEERYEMVIEICDWVEGGYTLDGKMAETVRRWRERCERGGSGVVG